MIHLLAGALIVDIRRSEILPINEPNVSIKENVSFTRSHINLEFLLTPLQL
jgi:hypothetical protein